MRSTRHSGWGSLSNKVWTFEFLLARLTEGGRTETLALYSLRKYRHLKVSFAEHRARRPSSPFASGCTPRRIPQRLNSSSNRTPPDSPPPSVQCFYPTYYNFRVMSNCRLDISRRTDYVSRTPLPPFRDAHIFLFPSCWTRIETLVRE